MKCDSLTKENGDVFFPLENYLSIDGSHINS
jgi:hypothetical protein